MKLNFSLLILLIGYLIPFNGNSQALNYSHIPKMELHDMNDKVVSTDVLHNDKDPFIVVFWAIWNKTSLLELNTIHEKYDEWQKKYSLKIFAVSIDEKERLQRAKGYAEAKNWHYDVFFDEHGTFEHAMNINGVPHIMLFNGNREVVWEMHEYHSGDEEDLKKQLNILLMTPDPVIISNTTKNEKN